MEFVHNYWYAASWAKDLGSEPKGLRILNKPIVLFRTSDGAVAVMDDLCPHRFVPLHLGSVVHGNRIRCGYHGLEFDTAGNCVHNPHTSGRIPPAAKVKTYAAAERNGMVWVWLGDKPADQDLIPDLGLLEAHKIPPVDGQRYISTNGATSFVMNANYTLIGDNLLDLGHACILHDGLLGNHEMADAELSIEETEHGFIVRRLAVDTTLPKLFEVMLGRPDIERGDTWADMELIGPSCFINHAGVSPSGQGRSGGVGLYAVNTLTPIDDKSTMYFVAATIVNPPSDDPEVLAGIGRNMTEVAGFAFTQQDKVILEAQQGTLSDEAQNTSRPAMFDIDIGSTRYSRHLKALLDAERPKVPA